MYRVASILTVLIFVSSLSAGKPSFAFEENFSPLAAEAKVSPSSETTERLGVLRQLATALATGGNALSRFRGPRAENEKGKDSFSPPIPGMACSVDEIVYYVSCYSASIGSDEEAGWRYTRLITDLGTALPSDHWRGIETAPRLESIRSYTYEDRSSDAHIDIDLVPQFGAQGEYSYLVTIFGWAATDPRL